MSSAGIKNAHKTSYIDKLDNNTYLEVGAMNVSSQSFSKSISIKKQGSKKKSVTSNHTQRINEDKSDERSHMSSGMSERAFRKSRLNTH